MEEENIYPIFDRMLSRKDKEELLGQRGVMLWLTGLSGSGKSTIAIALERELHKRGLLCRILDGDNIRSGINNNLGFSAEDRVENIRRIAEIGKLFVDTGIITIAAFISPGNELRQMAARIIGIEDFLEIYVSTPFLPTMGSTNSNKVLTDSSKLSLEVSKDKAGCSPLLVKKEKKYNSL